MVEELVMEIEVVEGEVMEVREGNVAEGKVVEEMALVVRIQELDLAVCQHMLHPMVSLILSTRTRMVFALYAMMVHTFQRGLKLVHLIFSNCFSMIVLWIDFCGARTHT